MRAGQGLPGNMQIPKTVFRTFSYFNEAGALPPRKCRRAATSGKRTELCFNEAGACHPGNLIRPAADEKI